MKIIRTGGRVCFSDLPLQVNWRLTTNCNYRCSYCFLYGKSKTPPPPLPFSTLDQLKIAVDNIASLNRPWYFFVLGGGEPTFHPHISELILMLHESLEDRLNKILIITNGSRNEALYGKIAEISSLVNISLLISIHTDHVEMPHILKLIENLSKNVDMDFSLMFNPDKRDLVYEIYETMLEQRKNFRFNMNVSMLRDGDRVDPRYTPEDFTWQKESNARFRELAKSVKFPAPKRKNPPLSMQTFTDIEDEGELKTFKNVDYSQKYTNGMIQFKGMYCIANSALLSIPANGRCNGMVCNDDPVICNIYDKDCFKPVRDRLIHSVKCTKRLCGCGANYCIPKFSSEEEAKKYVEFAQKRQAELFAAYDTTHAVKTI